MPSRCGTPEGPPAQSPAKPDIALDPALRSVSQNRACFQALSSNSFGKWALQFQQYALQFESTLGMGLGTVPGPMLSPLTACCLCQFMHLL